MAQQTQLSAAIATTNAVSMTVDDAYGFPASGTYTILVESELMRVTAGHGTTTWTMSRAYGGTTAATHADNSAVYLVADGYADIADVLATMDISVGTGSADRRVLLADLLDDARAQTDSDTGRTFFRVPLVSGTTTVYTEVRYSGCTSLVEATGSVYTLDGRALDLVSVTTVEYRTLGAAAYTALAGTDWELVAGYGPGLMGTDWPAEDIALVHGGALSAWPVGRVKIIGALGFPAIPDVVKRANIDKAREAYRQGPGGGPSQVGVNTFGTPIYTTGNPSEYRAMLRVGGPYVKRNWKLTAGG